MGIVNDITGVRFGRLTVVRMLTERRNRRAVYVCRCDCGAEKELIGTALRAGDAISCGCYDRERRRTHGQASGGKHSLTYVSWSAAIQRCTNPRNPKYANYGGRGIGICDRWRNSFEAFLTDMGERPTAGHSLDRHPDQNGNYEPGNCRWATVVEQNRNTRASRLSAGDVDEIRRSPERNGDLARRYGVHPSHVSKIRSGSKWREAV